MRGEITTAGFIIKELVYNLYDMEPDYALGWKWPFTFIRDLAL
jgi:hypothetical protein